MSGAVETLALLSQTSPPGPLSETERGNRRRSVFLPLSASERGPGGEVSSKRTTTARAVFIGLIVLIAIQLGFGQYAERNPKRKDPTYGDKLDKLNARADGRPLVLMLGSSRTLLGFHAAQVEAEIPGVRAFNFGTPAAGPITHFVYLRRLLKAGIVPDLLLIEVLPPALADGPDGPGEQLFFTGERLSSDEVDLVVRFGFPEDRARDAWRGSVYTPASSLRFQLLGRLLPSWIPWNLRGDWSRNTDAHGWATPPRQTVSADERHERTAKAESEYRNTLKALTPEGRPLLALAELLELCRERGIPARVVVMPEAPSFQKPNRKRSIARRDGTRFAKVALSLRDRWRVEEMRFECELACAGFGRLLCDLASCRGATGLPCSGRFRWQ